MKKTEKSESIQNDFHLVKKNIELLYNENIENREEILNETSKRFNEIIKFFKGAKKLVQILFMLCFVLFTLVILSLIFNDKINHLNNEIDDIKTDTIANQILGVRRVMLPDSTYSTTYDYRTRNNKVVSYNDLLQEIDSLNLINEKNESKIDSLELKLSLQNNKVELAEKYYDIRFWRSSKVKKRDTIHYINIESKKIDSAFILLNVYRKNLFYNKNTNEWEIKQQ
ncbi:hypothetical protein EOD40_00185 [Flavobacterium sufflavum]|uniref:Uncharacterized protein n=1 Tax=Flavobacterium sufflavum TaxID=1921138 RepID=A0A3S3SZG4_9FLAO|nr:hypothetical protein [Flavobacterium sufflavum]RVT79568.1 hypothetical protein EOD40_00185 [Flavobacterium sufflavum]